jgi:hypothetical protein
VVGTRTTLPNSCREETEINNGIKKGFFFKFINFKKASSGLKSKS